MSATEEPIPEFAGRVPTIRELEKLRETINDHSRLINSLLKPPPIRINGTPVACTVTSLTGDKGRYSVTAYLGPYNSSATGTDLALSDLNQRSRPAVLWNLSEIGGGGSALVVGQVVDASVAGFANGMPLLKTGGGGGGSSDSDIPLFLTGNTFCGETYTARVASKPASPIAFNSHNTKFVTFQTFYTWDNNSEQVIVANLALSGQVGHSLTLTTNSLNAQVYFAKDSGLLDVATGLRVLEIRAVAVATNCNS